MAYTSYKDTTISSPSLRQKNWKEVCSRESWIAQQHQIGYALRTAVLMQASPSHCPSFRSCEPSQSAIPLQVQASYSFQQESQLCALLAADRFMHVTRDPLRSFKVCTEVQRMDHNTKRHRSCD